MRKKKRSTVRGIWRTKEVGMVVYHWTCEFCGDGYRASMNRDKVATWAIRHLRAHIARLARELPEDA